MAGVFYIGSNNNTSATSLDPVRITDSKTIESSSPLSVLSSSIPELSHTPHTDPTYLADSTVDSDELVYQITNEHFDSSNSLLGTDALHGQGVVGIDGTGGPQPIPNSGIDGTGGPQPIPNPGIDGTGGPKPLAAILGTLQHIDGRMLISGQLTVTNSETIVDGGVAADPSALDDGQVVLVIGHVDVVNNITTAKRIIPLTQISGAITGIGDGTITMLGQTIVLHDDIIFGGTATQFSDLQEGDMINVSGFKLPDGNLSATRVERVSATVDKVTG
ncbi:MAG: DUF5666 domain-containing protein, partial [Bdellovibrionales bacterium]